MLNPIKKIQKWNLNRKQKKINNKYEKEGYSDELLEEQIKLNKEKFELNIPDKEYLQ